MPQERGDRCPRDALWTAALSEVIEEFLLLEVPQELNQEERVSLCPLHQVIGEAPDTGLWQGQTLLHQRLDSRDIERTQIEPHSRRFAHEAWDQFGHWMAPVDLLRSIGTHNEQREMLDSSCDKSQQIEGGTVCPVDVLEDEYGRFRRGERYEKRVSLLEKVTLARCIPRLECGRRVGELGQGLDATHDLDPGTVWRRLCAVEAVPGQHRRAALSSCQGEVICKGGLPDSGLATDQDETTLTISCRAQAGTEKGELSVAAEQGWA